MEEVKYDLVFVDEFFEECCFWMGILIFIEGRVVEMGDVVIVDFVGIILLEMEGEEV